jgi:hypothetical protein
MRCARSLVRGDLAGALDHNALIVVLAPLAVVGWALWMWRAWSGREPIQTPARARTKKILLAALIVVMVAFTVYRNLPMARSVHHSRSIPGVRADRDARRIQEHPSLHQANYLPNTVMPS